MSNVTAKFRSMLRIGGDDLEKFAEIARWDRKEFFQVNPKWRRLYSKRILCIALCQGAALHFIDGKTGINDFDVYTFYRANPTKALYAKRIKSFDFGDAKFGQSKDRPNFIGRRVDCLWRSIEAKKSEDYASAVCRYLTEMKTRTARLLSEKAIVILVPDVGKVIWPIQICNLQSVL